jgi:hypothetical protein
MRIGPSNISKPHGSDEDRGGRSLRIVECGILGIPGETAAAAVRRSAIIGDDNNLSRSQP